MPGVSKISDTLSSVFLGVIKVRIESLALEVVEDHQVLKARVVWEQTNRPSQDLVFRARFLSPIIRKTAEPFLLAAAVPAMLAGEERIAIDDAIDPVLALGIPSALSILQHWVSDFPKKKAVPIIEAPLASREVAEKRETASFFSGGADALFTLLHHQERVSFDSDSAIRTALMVYGFDLGFSGRDESSQFAHFFAQAEKFLKPRAVTLLGVETNLREMDGSVGFWGRAFHGFGLAAVAHLFENSFKEVLIGTNGEPLSEAVQVPWGGHPVLFGYLCSSVLQLRSPFVEKSRLERLRAIAQQEDARAALRVCFRFGESTINCGRCEKCVRTRLALWIVGGDPNVGFDPPAFNESLFHDIAISSDVGEMEHEELAKALKEKGDTRFLQVELDLLARWQRFKHWRDERGVRGFVKKLAKKAIKFR